MQVWLTNLSDVNVTKVNGKSMSGASYLGHNDAFDIAGRKFRLEYEDQYRTVPPPLVKVCRLHLVTVGPRRWRPTDCTSWLSTCSAVHGMPASTH